jgi:hypothetical protein
VLTTYNKSEILLLGKTVLKMFNPKTGKTHKTEFIVVEQEATPILGNQSIQNMNLVTINYRNILALKSEEIILTEELVFSEYSDVFEGTGCLPGVYRLETDPSVKPVVHPPRKIPIALRDKLKIELDRLTDRKIIVPVTEPTQWVNDLVIVEKSNSKLHICLDPRDLNKAIQ